MYPLYPAGWSGATPFSGNRQLTKNRGTHRPPGSHLFSQPAIPVTCGYRPLTAGNALTGQKIKNLRHPGFYFFRYPVLKIMVGSQTHYSFVYTHHIRFHMELFPFSKALHKSKDPVRQITEGTGDHHFRCRLVLVNDGSDHRHVHFPGSLDTVDMFEEQLVSLGTHRIAKRPDGTPARDDLEEAERIGRGGFGMWADPRIREQ